MDYRSYRLTFMEHVKIIGIAVMLSAVIAYLFYDSWWGMLIVPIVLLIGYRSSTISGRQRVQDRLAAEFLDVLRTVSTALLAGLSMENAWREAEREICVLYGQDSVMAIELTEINNSVKVGIALERLLEDLAERSGNPDIAGFAEVFAFAKRSGGNFVTIIEQTANHMRARFDTEREIQVLVASKRMEQKVMNVMPMFILAYLKVTSTGFLDILYRNSGGILFMSACLLAYGLALLLAKRILHIRV